MGQAHPNDGGGIVRRRLGWLWSLAILTEAFHGEARAAGRVRAQGAPFDLGGLVDVRVWDPASDAQSTSCPTAWMDTPEAFGAAFEASLRRGVRSSAEEEAVVGRSALAGFTDNFGGALTNTGATAQYVAAVGRALLPSASRAAASWSFYVWVGTDTVNAFALPGGHVIVSEAMLETITSEAELALVLGHEIGHVELGHPMAVIETMRALGVSSDSVVGNAVAQIVRRPYRSTAELAADVWGAKAIHAAGYSVVAANDLWVRQAGREAPAATGLIGLFEAGVRAVVDTHPESTRRACELRRTATALQASDPLRIGYVGRSNYQQRKSMAEGVQ